MRRGAYAALMIFVVWPDVGATAAERSAQEWLATMNQAFAERSYDGVFSYFDGADVASLRIVHAVIDDVQHERLVHLNGAPREIVRRGNEVACILQPGDEMLALEASIPSGPFARAFTRSFEALTDTYDLTVTGTDRVADRSAVVVRVAPLDQDRYGYRLWLDAETGLLLRSEMVDMTGARLEIFQFAHVAIDQPIDAELLRPTTPTGTVTSHLDLVADSKLPPSPAQWRASWVPRGFMMAAWDIRRTPATQRSMNTLMYSDGLATFSVFVEEMPESGAASLVSRTGGTVVVTHMARGADQAAYLVTVVGEVPLATAQRVARSVDPVGD